MQRKAPSRVQEGRVRLPLSDMFKVGRVARRQMNYDQS